MALSIGIQIRLERLDPEALASAAADATPYIVRDQPTTWLMTGQRHPHFHEFA